MRRMANGGRRGFDGNARVVGAPGEGEPKADLIGEPDPGSGTDRGRPKRVAQPREAGCAPAINYFYFLVFASALAAASAAAASLAVGIVPPAAWARLMSDSPDPAKTSSITP